jgi:hypothetical protein
MDTVGHWAIAYHTNSTSERAQRWYYVVRVAMVDGKYWELYRHPAGLSAKSHSAILQAAARASVETIHGLFTAAPPPRHGPELVPWHRGTAASVL